MDTNLYKIREVLKGSKLSAKNQDELITLFSSVPDAELESVAKLLSEDPGLAETLNSNLQRKREALTVGSSDLWNSILTDEKDQLAAIKN
ncbi:MAG: hypothetical protein WC480_01995 [Patescibacteria group bacterium]